MPDDQEERLKWAERLRKQIERLKTGDESQDETDNPAEQQPGESPKAYIERRTRELNRKKPDQ